jgi:hypothetical protein
MPNILLQTTIENDPHDWNIGRFSRLAEYLTQQRDMAGRPAFRVTARNRSHPGQPDPVLAALHESDIDQLWLFAVDPGDGLVAANYAGIRRFRQRGGGLVVTLDRMEPARSILRMEDVGITRRHHSGDNEDFQRVRPVGHIHPVMRDRHSPTGVIQYLPAHPHDGTVSAPPGNASARIIMAGQSPASGRRFDIAVAFERSAHGGRAMAHASFHSFTDRSWDHMAGCPSSASGPAGDGMARFPEVLRSTMQYVSNIAFWLNA